MNNIDFTTGKLMPKMIKFSLPLILAIVLQALYGAVDLVIVGRFGDSASQAAVATGSHVMQTFTGIVTGFTMGITVVIGRFVGLKQQEKLGKVVGNVTIAFTVFTIIITALMAGLSNVFVDLLQVPVEAKQKCFYYILICSLGFIFVIGYNVISGFFRGVGNSNLPLIFIAVACVLNIAFDFLFVAGFHLDAVGAAVATVLAQAFSMFVSVVALYKKREVFNIHKSDFKYDKDILKSVFKVGAPIALQDGLTNVSFLIIHSFINGMGLSESAAIGIGEKLFVVLSIVPMAFMSTLATVVSQNDGAGEKHRTKLALVEGCFISFIFGLIPFMFTFFGGEMLAKIFSNDVDVINKTALFLRSSGFEYLLLAFVFCFIGYFNGKRQSLFVMSQGLVSTFLFRIPISYHFSTLADTNMYLMGVAIPISAAVSLLLCLIYYVVFTYKENKKEKSKQVNTTNLG